METQRAIGLLIERRNSYGTERVSVRVIARKEGEDHPCNVTSGPAEGLGLYGFVSDYNDNDFIGYEPEFRDRFSIDLRALAEMTKLLKRVQARITRDHAHEPGDVFVALATAIGAAFAVQCVSDRGSRYSDSDWRFLTIGEGRNVYRAQIEAARADAKIAKDGRAA